MQTLLANSLKLDGAVFRNSTDYNEVAFVAFTNVSKLMVPFGELSNEKQVSDTFQKIKEWSHEMNSAKLSYTQALEFVDTQVFNYDDRRGRLLVVIGNNGDQ